MVKDYRFFYTHKDNEYSNEFDINLLLLKLISFFSITFVIVIMTIMKKCSLLCFILIELGLLTNIYLKQNSTLSLIFKFIFSYIYFFLTCKYTMYGTGIMFMSFYTFFNLVIFRKKDYHIQHSKKITYYNYMLLINLGAIFYLVTSIFLTSIASKFFITDSVVSTLLLICFIVKNERYQDFYLIKMLSLVLLMFLWIKAYFEFNSNEILFILFLFSSLLFYELGRYILSLKIKFIKRKESNLIKNTFD